MNAFREEPRRALERMLANGPLTAVPKRPSDQDLLVALAAARFDPAQTYDEAAVNETLKAWVATFCEPDAIDHVTLRRLLVDSRLMTRTASGSSYRVDRAKAGRLEAAEGIDPAAVLAAIRAERAARKKRSSA